MKLRALPLTTIVASLFALAGCGRQAIPATTVAQSSAAALALVEASAAAHGLDRYRGLHDVSVRYEGRWLSIVDKVQPILVDKNYRKGSEERWLIRERVLAQHHLGPAGEKHVLRSPGAIQVWYDGRVNADRAKDAAAAIVADSYTMFLTGPIFFLDRGARLLPAGEGEVDGAPCDRVLAVLQPGLGNATEDRVLLSIDRATKRLLRVRFTLNGLPSTVGAEVDVTFSAHRTIAGVLWPTEFFERVRAPLAIPAHRWRLLGLDVDRGFTAEDLAGPSYRNTAAAAAKAPA